MNRLFIGYGGIAAIAMALLLGCSQPSSNTSTSGNTSPAPASGAANSSGTGNSGATAVAAPGTVSSLAWTSGLPTISALSQTTASFILGTPKDSKAYYVILPAGAVSPTAAQIRSGQDSNNAAVSLSSSISLFASIQNTTTIANLSAATSYVIYAVAVSNEKSEVSAIYAGTFSTPDYSYPVDANTIAFWDFGDGGSSDAATLTTAVNTKIFSDHSGNGNDLYLNKAGSPATPLAYSSDTSWTFAKHKFSLNFQGINTNAGGGGYYLQTQLGAALNQQTFKGTGYTIEAIIKIDSAWASLSNKWMGIMSLSYPQSNGSYAYTNDDPPFGWTISSLEEVQFYTMSYANGSWNTASSTNWSSGLSSGAWHHIVIVETPGTDVNNRVMFIDGVQSTRTVNANTNGIPAQGSLYSMFYLIGSNSFQKDASTQSFNPFKGKIDVIRIEKGVLPKSQWLLDSISK